MGRPPPSFPKSKQQLKAKAATATATAAQSQQRSALHSCALRCLFCVLFAFALFAYFFGQSVTLVLNRTYQLRTNEILGSLTLLSDASIPYSRPLNSTIPMHSPKISRQSQSSSQSSLSSLSSSSLSPSFDRVFTVGYCCDDSNPNAFCKPHSFVLSLAHRLFDRLQNEHHSHVTGADQHRHPLYSSLNHSHLNKPRFDRLELQQLTKEGLAPLWVLSGVTPGLKLAKVPGPKVKPPKTLPRDWSYFLHPYHHGSISHRNHSHRRLADDKGVSMVTQTSLDQWHSPDILLCQGFFYHPLLKKSRFQAVPNDQASDDYGIGDQVSSLRQYLTQSEINDIEEWIKDTEQIKGMKLSEYQKYEVPVKKRLMMIVNRTLREFAAGHRIHLGKQSAFPRHSVSGLNRLDILSEEWNPQFWWLWPRPSKAIPHSSQILTYLIEKQRLKMIESERRMRKHMAKSSSKLDKLLDATTFQRTVKFPSVASIITDYQRLKRESRDQDKNTQDEKMDQLLIGRDLFKRPFLTTINNEPWGGGRTPIYDVLLDTVHHERFQLCLSTHYSPSIWYEFERHMNGKNELLLFNRFQFRSYYYRYHHVNALRPIGVSSECPHFFEYPPTMAKLLSDTNNDDINTKVLGSRFKVKSDSEVESLGLQLPPEMAGSRTLTSMVELPGLNPSINSIVFTPSMIAKLKNDIGNDKFDDLMRLASNNFAQSMLVEKRDLALFLVRHCFMSYYWPTSLVRVVFMDMLNERYKQMAHDLDDENDDNDHMHNMDKKWANHLRSLTHDGRDPVMSLSGCHPSQLPVESKQTMLERKISKMSRNCKKRAHQTTTKNRNNNKSDQMNGVNDNPDCYGIGHTDSATALARHFKFFIVFENTMINGYLTEKLFNAFYAHSIPVYWGSQNISMDQWINPKAYINCGKYIDYELSKQVQRLNKKESEHTLYPKVRKLIESSVNECINELIEIDRDSSKYLSMITEPIFINDNWEDTPFDLSQVSHQIESAMRLTDSYVFPFQSQL